MQASPFADQVAKVKEVHARWQQASFARQRYYSTFLSESDSESLTVFNTEILQHLAGNVINKGHQDRYQSEQQERYLLSTCGIGFKKDQTLNEFAEEYAILMDA